MAKKNTVVARLIMTKPNNSKIIVEVLEGAGFTNFYTWYRQEGRKRKVLLRTSNRNDGISPHWRAPFVSKGLDVLAARSVQFMKDVTGVTIKILKKRRYAFMTTCSPDQLGALPQAARTSEILAAAKGIPVSIPAGYLTLQQRMDILTGTKR